ncbi:two component transcriptional regulator, LytTR family [Hymenobacter gelipurpurascens]|uniref:Two component transcriptional regulator, LytTR family n=1 Tax=Hymenobacter gelipurpurascens TaxID=89968 RepID=A0A212T4H5_9BACT|nr:LytTR family DNA-binding domain-containing protein [Hymenobacter gelipurpurascens]SNC60909.1 two component transcriptional regulator, LytTR family [Hymenobacter gelipurpurascens]
MDVVLIEDEAVAADGLVALLARYDPGIRVVERLDSVEDAVQWFAGNPPPHLTLLDVQLADGLCFDIFPKVSIHCPIIFTTAYDQYALQAFQVTSIDYLLKPIAYPDLHRALDKLRRLTTEYAPPSEVSLRQLATVFHQFQKPYKTRFLARCNDRIQFKTTEEIACFCADGKFVYLIGLDQRRFLVDYTLEQLETLLDPSQFFRLNRKYLVSLAAVKDIRTHSGSRLRVLLQPAPFTEVIISRERVAEFKAWLDH